MIAILLDHTELYYTGLNIIDYNIYVVNALTLFFIISGYLIYKESKFDFKNKIKSIAKTLLLPYLIFSFLISLSKYAHKSPMVNLRGLLPLSFFLRVFLH